MIASHSGLPDTSLDVLEEKLHARLARLRKLLVEQDDPQAAAYCIRETDLIEAKLLQNPEHVQKCAATAKDDDAPRACDPWIAVSF
ncbi:MAG: hypothetical protein AAFV45_07445 [Pseudomonadota bacterium]